MSDRDTYGLYTWEGQYGDIEADEQDRPRRKRPGPEFPFTLVSRCKSCDGYMADLAAYAGKIVPKARATTCHHCRGDVRCASGKHHIQPGKTCWTCEVFRDR